MTNNPNNIRLGPCRVRWAGKDIGLTKGGVDVTLKTSTKMVQVDQFGDTPLDEYITGRTLTVKAPFGETDVVSISNYLKQSQANLIDNGTYATATVTVTTNPAANDTLTVNGHVFTFVTTSGTTATPMAADTITIGASPTATAANIVTALNASSDPLVIAGVYTASAAVITVTYYQTGTAGNSFTLARTGTGITVGGATLTGGTDGTRRRVEVLSGVGQSLRAQAQILTLHPQNKADNDSTEDFVVPIAATNGGFSFAYKLNEERVFTIEWMGYPDATTTRLFLFGNPN